MSDDFDRKPTLLLKAGAYGFAIERRAIQWCYAGGGHAGCGGCVWALEFVDVPRPADFVLYEFRTDSHGQRHRTINCESHADLLVCFERMMGRALHVDVESRFSPWAKEPPWFFRKLQTPVVPENRT